MAKTISSDLLKREQAVRANIEEYAELFDIDPSLVRAVITQESKFVSDAKSPTGAFGYGQLTKIGSDQVRLIAEMSPFAKDLRDFNKDHASDPDKGVKAICATLWWLFYVKYKGVADKKTQLEAVLTFYNAGGRPAALIVKKGGHRAALDEIKALPANQRSQAAVYAPEVMDWFVAWHDALAEKKAEEPVPAVPQPKPEIVVVAENPFAEQRTGFYGPLIESLALLSKIDPGVKMVKQTTDSMTEIRLVFNGKY